MALPTLLEFRIESVPRPECRNLPKLVADSSGGQGGRERFRIANRGRSCRGLARNGQHGNVILLAEALRGSGNLFRRFCTDGRGSLETKEFATLVTSLNDPVGNQRKLCAFSQPGRCFRVSNVRHNPKRETGVTCNLVAIHIRHLVTGAGDRQSTVSASAQYQAGCKAALGAAN